MLYLYYFSLRWTRSVDEMVTVLYSYRFNTRQMYI